MSSRFRLMPAWMRSVVWAALTAILYILTARMGLLMAMPPAMKATAVWPPSGIALAALLLAGSRVLPGIWLGAFLANLWDAFTGSQPTLLGPHLAASAGIATGSTLQALLALTLLRRCAALDSLLRQTRSCFQFVGVVLLACMVGATCGVTSLAATGLMPLADATFTWWTWWLGDTVGILVIAPLVLSWNEPLAFEWRSRWWVEAGVLLGLVAGVGFCVFGGSQEWHLVPGVLVYLSVPLLVWAAFRFGLHGAMLCLVLVSSLAIWGTVHGRGPFVQRTLNDSLLLLQTFMGVLAVTVLALAGALAERREADRSRRKVIAELENALTEIKTLRGLIPICAWCKSVRNNQGSWEQLEKYLQHRTLAEFSHGICPECLEKRFQEETVVG